jgi:hypothetical protein|tara:strand:+ start:101 stop:547 length:447 start_codon:yes stop_codon:yes gene_type:complete
MCNLNAFDRLDKDAKKIVTDKIAQNTTSLMSVSKKYDHDLLGENEIKELGLQPRKEYSGEIFAYSYAIVGTAISLQLDDFADVIACIFWINGVSNLKFVSSKNYNEDYLNEQLDISAQEYIVNTKISQEKQIKVAKEKLNTVEELKVA